MEPDYDWRKDLQRAVWLGKNSDEYRAITSYIETLVSEVQEWTDAASDNMCIDLEGECERLREALGRIEHGCMFPEDDVQRAIRDVSRAAMTGGEACEMYDKLGRDGAGW
jgi:NTP pyrophosphatase (non-canonical NTP hydrolase)